MPKRAITTLAYIGIFVLAMVAAFFCASVFDHAWRVLAGPIYKVIFRLPRIFGMIIPTLYILLAALSAIATAFVVSYFSLKFLHRYSIVGQHSKGVALVYALLWPFVLTSCVCSLGVYFIVPFPSPNPYPGAVVETAWHGSAGGYISTTYKYTIELPLDEVEEYYVAEMQKYCVEGWGFVDCNDPMRCRIAECEISRPLVRWAKDAQSFKVILRSESETKTNVVYFETGLDL